MSGMLLVIFFWGMIIFVILYRILKKIVSERNDLKIVLMSATINSELFSAYFNAPVIQVPGRTYPVQIEYIPFEKEDPNLVEENAYKQRMDAEVKLSVSVRSEKIKSGPYLRIMEKIDHSISSSERGDLLIFLSGINEISILAEELQEYANMNKRWIILILHSTLSAGEQEKVN
jgi:HrpA-like RNA helicase